MASSGPPAECAPTLARRSRARRCRERKVARLFFRGVRAAAGAPGLCTSSASPSDREAGGGPTDNLYAYCWELFCLEHGIRPKGPARGDRAIDDDDAISLLSETETGSYKPKSVFVDVVPTILDGLRTEHVQNPRDDFAYRKYDLAIYNKIPIYQVPKAEHPDGHTYNIAQSTNHQGEALSDAQQGHEIEGDVQPGSDQTIGNAKDLNHLPEHPRSNDEEEANHREAQDQHQQHAQDLQGSERSAPSPQSGLSRGGENDKLDGGARFQDDEDRQRDDFTDYSDENADEEDHIDDDLADSLLFHIETTGAETEENLVLWCLQFLEEEIQTENQLGEALHQIKATIEMLIREGMLVIDSLSQDPLCPEGRTLSCPST